MAGKRSYDDPCGIARALDVVGERWALLVVRELILGPKRFTDLRAGLPNVSPDVLAQRLRDLERAGVVRRATLPRPAGTQVYELTEWGRDLEPVVLGLGAWGSRAPFPPGDARLGVDSAVVALKTLFHQAAAGTLQEGYKPRPRAVAEVEPPAAKAPERRRDGRPPPRAATVPSRADIASSARPVEALVRL